MFREDEIIFSEDIMLYIIEKYTNKEEGVRNLNRCLETIISKTNIHNLTNNKGTEDDIPLTFKIKDFKLPLMVTKDIINELLKIDNDTMKAPEHMYI
jgi:ATP-dependent Lon protease